MVSKWTKLVFFYAYNNEFTGNVPDISNLNSLQYFLIENNNMEGPLPHIPLSLNQCDISGNVDLCKVYVPDIDVCNYKDVPSCKFFVSSKSSRTSSISLIPSENIQTSINTTAHLDTTSNVKSMRANEDFGVSGTATSNSQITVLATQISLETKFLPFKFLYLQLWWW